MKAKTFYSAHRWLGFVVGLQLLLWSAGGLIFATHDIGWVRGVEGKATVEAPTLVLDETVMGVSDVATASGLAEIRELHLRSMLGRRVFEVRGKKGTALVDAISGELLTPLVEATAREIARRDRAKPPAITEAVLLQKDDSTEYRGKPLPAWRVTLDDDDNTHVYVDASTGRITARRNDAWRRFDFFWMLHTMDYGSRDDFNTPWLIIFAGLGFLSALSGWVLWAIRVRRRRRGASP